MSTISHSTFITDALNLIVNYSNVSWLVGDRESKPNVSVTSGHDGSVDEVDEDSEDAANMFYDKAKSFFDNISCEALDRASGCVKRNFLILFTWMTFFHIIIVAALNLKFQSEMCLNELSLNFPDSIQLTSIHNPQVHPDWYYYHYYIYVSFYSVPDHFVNFFRM